MKGEGRSLREESVGVKKETRKRNREKEESEVKKEHRERKRDERGKTVTNCTIC